MNDALVRAALFPFETSEVAHLCVGSVNLWQLICACACLHVWVEATAILIYFACVCAGESLSSLSRGPGEQMAGSVKDEEKQLRQKIEGWDGTNSERHAWGTKESGVELRMAIVTPLRAVIFMIVVKIATNPKHFHCFLLVAYHYLWGISKFHPELTRESRLKQNNSCWAVLIHYHTLFFDKISLQRRNRLTSSRTDSLKTNPTPWFSFSIFMKWIKSFYLV